MPYRLPVQPDDFVHLAIVTNNLEPFWATIEGVWDTFSDELLVSSILYNTRIHCLVILPNRVDLIVSSPPSGIGTMTSLLFGMTTKSINSKSARINHVFGGNHHQSKLPTLGDFEIARKFLFRAPIRSGLCDRAENYPFSSLHRQQGYGSLSFPMWEPDGNIDRPDFVEWVNRPFPFSETLIETGLRRRIFRLPRHPTNGRRIRIQDSLLDSRPEK